MAVKLDGTDDYISKTVLTGYSSTATVGALSIWVRPDAWNQQGILIRNRNGSGTQCFFDGGKIYFHWGTQNALNYTVTLTTGRWYHVLCIANGSTHKIYLDGVDSASTSSSVQCGTFTGNFQVGGISAGGYHLNGAIADVAFWQGDYPQGDEIAQLAKSRVAGMPMQIRPSSLLFYSSMNAVGQGVSADGVTFKDNSSQANDIVGNNGANNTGMTGEADGAISYPIGAIYVDDQDVVAVSGQPTMARVTGIPFMRQWQPQRVGR